MRLAKITIPGLATMFVLVCGLWGCILAEARIVRHANEQTARILMELRILREGRMFPASQPVEPQSSGISLAS